MELPATYYTSSDTFYTVAHDIWQPRSNGERGLRSLYGESTQHTGPRPTTFRCATEHPINTPGSWKDTMLCCEHHCTEWSRSAKMKDAGRIYPCT
eukprot:917433-Amphidinium_carterae.5